VFPWGLPSVRAAPPSFTQEQEEEEETMRVGNVCLDGAFDDPLAMIRRAEAELRNITYDTLVGTGFSGALVIPVIARGLNKQFLLLRKPGDSHHHGDAPGEGDFGRRWVFVDDGISTGTTWRRVRDQIQAIAAQARIPQEFQGAYLYGHPPFFPPRFVPPGHEWLTTGYDRQ
jgi:hypothetical protein